MHVHTVHTREGRAGHRLAVAAVPVPRVRRRAAGTATGSSTEETATVVVGRRSAASCARGGDVGDNPEFSDGPVPSGRRVIIRPVCVPLGIEVFIFFTAATGRPGRSQGARVSRTREAVNFYGPAHETEPTANVS
ncbi:hypothetical protein [Streptomyces sp. NPDC060366]|uniref:hypothetical protein n=1 Tax=Streptomyces sp. NPDC060366 TaxID=3347105 RepID=UPI0036507BBD